jgi:WD40 repeat protein
VPGLAAPSPAQHLPAPRTLPHVPGYVEKGVRLRTITGKIGTVFGVAFSPNGRLLAAPGADGAVYLWEPAAGKEVLMLRGHRQAGWRVAFSPDGRFLASSSFDGTVRVWDVAGVGGKPLVRDAGRG